MSTKTFNETSLSAKSLINTLYFGHGVTKVVTSSYVEVDGVFRLNW